MSVLKSEYKLVTIIFLSCLDDSSDPDLYQARINMLRSRVCIHKKTYSINCLGHLSWTMSCIQNLSLLFICLLPLVCLLHSLTDTIVYFFITSLIYLFLYRCFHPGSVNIAFTLGFFFCPNFICMMLTNVKELNNQHKNDPNQTQLFLSKFGCCVVLLKNF